MGGRVIQGFFIGGAMRPQPMQRRAVATWPMAHASGAPAPAFGGGEAAFQARMAPGRPMLVHQGAGQAVQRHGGSGGFAVDAASIGIAGTGGRPLPQSLLAKMESAFGADFSAVRVHVGPQASRIGAIAFTMGDDLYFAPGQFQPESAKGQQLIGHELAHVIQQRQGRVRAPSSGVAVVQDMALEAEADRLGMRAAMQAKLLHQPAPGGRSQPRRSARSIQRMESYSWSDEEEEVEDDDYGQDDEYDPSEHPEEYDPEEFMGMGGDTRPSAYSSVFGSVYSGGGGYVSTNVKTMNGVLTLTCAQFKCTNKIHSTRCNGVVYVIKGSSLSPTTPVTKTKKKKRVTENEKPPICHILDWVILREAMKAFLGSTVNSGFEKFLCWGNLDNLTTGRRTCNSKSNKGQVKYTDLGKGDKLKVDSYVAKMFKAYQTSSTPGHYGDIL